MKYCIDDNSDDDTKIIVNDLKKSFHFKTLLRNDKIKDYKNHILGFNISKYENILVMDGAFNTIQNIFLTYIHHLIKIIMIL